MADFRHCASSHGLKGSRAILVQETPLACLRAQQLWLRSALLPLQVLPHSLTSRPPSWAIALQSSAKKRTGGVSMVERVGKFGLIGAGLLLAAFFSRDAAAQAITKPVTLVVPYAAGGGTDTVARLIGNHMSRTLGQSVIIENV